ncbi:MAG: radical SAM protein [Chloroflexi bacterium]|nr:radical SAM protein [Chloroflexota bacterium]
MTDHPDKYLEHGADVVILGEGEETLLEVLGTLTPETLTPSPSPSGRGEEVAPSPPSPLSHKGRGRNDAAAGGDSALGEALTPALPSRRGENHKPAVDRPSPPGEGQRSAATRGEVSSSLLPAGIAVLRDGAVERTLPRPVIRDLDALPFPAWDLVDLNRYKHVWREHHGYFSVNMVTTRGCPFHCNWCAKPIWGQKYSVRSPQNVVAEMKWLRDHVQPDHIWFMDDIMGIQDKWIEQFADELDAQGVHIPFKSLNRVDLLLRGRTIPALARAGAKIVWVGAESGSQKILDAMDKGTQVTQIYEATKQLHAHGVKVAFFLQFGYPGETREDVEATLQMVRDLMPDDIGISVSYPLPGTPFYERVKLELGERANWVDSEDLAMLYRGPFTTAFYRHLHTVVHKEYRARKTWAALRHGRFVSPRAFASAAYHWMTLPLARRTLDKLAQLPHPPLPTQPSAASNVSGP